MLRGEARGVEAMAEENREPHGPYEGVPRVTVRQLVEHPQLSVALKRVAGEAGLERPLRHPRVQKNGLALAGHHQGVVPTRVQLLGETELSYLNSLSNDARSLAARGFFSLGLSCVVVTGGHDPPRAFVSAAEATSTPLFISDARSSRTINALHAVLDDQLAPQTQLHGVLVDVFGVGILLLGNSGVGKSECALELVRRGHGLVADDVVRCDWRPPGQVFGEPAELLRYHIEIRGLGVLDIRSLFGVTSIRDRKRIDLVVRLCVWDEKEEFDRLGVEQRFMTILGTPIREHRVPVRAGRDMSSIIEMAARNELLRRDGRDTAREFLRSVEGHIVTDPEGGASNAGDAGNESQGPANPEAPAYKSTWSTLMPHAAGTESSAWIPAARVPRKEGER
jgi:HPr kinase/phosphorylase